MDYWKLTVDVAQVLTGVAAVVAIFLTRRGWKEAAKTANEQALRESVMATNYDIYKDILSQINSIQGNNSRYTSDLRTHIDTTANFLNELHGVGAFSTPATPERATELIDQWAKPSYQIIKNAVALKFSALDLTRILDMSGADFGNNTKVYNALWLMYHDLNEATTEIQDRWTNFSLANITIEQYDWLKRDTLKAIKVTEEFGNCVDDVLKHVYNKLVAESMGKSKKDIDMSEKRRIITLNGLRDNRAENAS